MSLSQGHSASRWQSWGLNLADAWNEASVQLSVLLQTQRCSGASLMSAALLPGALHSLPFQDQFSVQPGELGWGPIPLPSCNDL